MFGIRISFTGQCSRLTLALRQNCSHLSSNSFVRTLLGLIHRGLSWVIFIRRLLVMDHYKCSMDPFRRIPRCRMRLRFLACLLLSLGLTIYVILSSYYDVNVVRVPTEKVSPFRPGATEMISLLSTRLEDLTQKEFYSLPGYSNITREEYEIARFYNRFMESCHSRDTGLKMKLPLELPLCPCLPHTLKGSKYNMSSNPNDTTIYRWRHSEFKVHPGGWWRPLECKPRWTVAVIIPYRLREPHLKILSEHLNHYLPRQQIEYRIFVIQQMKPALFNRAALMNIGILEALRSKEHRFDCFVFHDVDILMIDDRAMYTCDFTPLHLGGYRNTTNYRVPFPNFFGALVALTLDQVSLTNGFSNRFFGWGGEDDEHFRRTTSIMNSSSFYRYPVAISRSNALFHVSSKETKKNLGTNRWSGTFYFPQERYLSEGINTAKYSVISSENLQYYTKVKVNIEKPDSQAGCTERGLDCWSRASMLNGTVDCCYEDEEFSCCRGPQRGERRKHKRFTLVR